MQRLEVGFSSEANDSEATATSVDPAASQEVRGRGGAPRDQKRSAEDDYAIDERGRVVPIIVNLFVLIAIYLNKMLFMNVWKPQNYLFYIKYFPSCDVFDI